MGYSGRHQQNIVLFADIYTVFDIDIYFAASNKIQFTIILNIEDFAKKYTGKITFWGEIDRQHILPLGSVDDVRRAVDRVAKAMLKKKRTGVIAQREFSASDPYENIRAVFDQWNKY